MTDRIECGIVLALLYCPSLLCQRPPTDFGKPAPCEVVRASVRVPCPENWNIVDEYKDPYKYETVIGNFPATPENRHKFSGPGLATIAVSTLPKGYENLERWLWVGRKNAPDAIESTLDVLNRAYGKIKVICMASPGNSSSAYASYFFQAGKAPLLLEMGYRAQDPKKDEYRAAVRWMIERVEPVRQARLLAAGAKRPDEIEGSAAARAELKTDRP